MSRIRQRDRTIRRNPHGEAGSRRIAAADQPLVQFAQQHHWISIESSDSTDRSHQQRHQHPGLQPFAGHIAGHDQQAAVSMGDDLEEKPAKQAEGIYFQFTPPTPSSFCRSTLDASGERR